MLENKIQQLVLFQCWGGYICQRSDVTLSDGEEGFPKADGQVKSLGIIKLQLYLFSKVSWQSSLLVFMEIEEKDASLDLMHLLMTVFVILFSGVCPRILSVWGNW